MSRNQTASSASSLFGLALIISVVAILYFAKEVLIPFALAIMLSFVLTPLVDRLEHWRLGRIPSVGIAVGLLCLAVVGTGWIVADQMVDVANNLPAYKSNILSKVKTFTSQQDGALSRARQAYDELTQELTDPKRVRPSTHSTSGDADKPSPREPVPVAVVANRTSPLAWLQGLMPPMFNALGTAGAVLLFVFFMLLEREDLRNRVIRLIGTGKISTTTLALDDAAHRVSRYLAMQLVVNATYGLAAAIGLYFIGIPNALLWGLLAGVLRYIPYVGPWIAATVPILLALAVFDSWAPPIYALSLFIVLELLSNNVMEPVLYRSSTGVSTIGILVAAIFWTWLWGAIGLVLSTPLTVCLTVLGRHVPRLEFLNILLTDEPALEPGARYYQRLLAEDQEEAAELIDKQLAESSLLDVFDTVLLPALTLAEQDGHRGRIDEDQRAFVRDSIQEFVEDHEDESPAPPDELSLDQQDTSATRTIMCLPARDPADEIAAEMLASLLESRGHKVLRASVRSLAGEMLDRVADENVDLVYVSAVPPFAMTHARYLSKRLRARFPKLKIIIGLWHTRSNGRKVMDQAQSARADKLVTTLTEAVDLAKQLGPSSPAAAAPPLVQTPGR